MSWIAITIGKGDDDKDQHSQGKIVEKHGRSLRAGLTEPFDRYRQRILGSFWCGGP